MTDDRLLGLATAAYVGGFVLHTADHARRGIDAVSESIVWAGTFSSMLVAAAVVLVLVRHPSAPLAAVAIGFPQALAFFAVHVLPEWSSELSDSYISGHVDGWSWAATLAEIAGAAAFGLAGAWVLKRRGGLGSVRAA